MSYEWGAVLAKPPSMLQNMLGNIVGSGVGGSIADLIIAVSDGASLEEAIAGAPVWARAILNSDQIKPRLPLVLMLLDKGFINVDEIRKWRSS